MNVTALLFAIVGTGAIAKGVEAWPRGTVPHNLARERHPLPAPSPDW